MTIAKQRWHLPLSILVAVSFSILMVSGDSGDGDGDEIMRFPSRLCMFFRTDALLLYWSQ